MSTTGDDLRKTMARFATGVTVVLAKDEDGTIYGMTANSVTSVSLDPPQILLCVGRERYMHGVLSRIRRLSVNILAEDQEAVSRYFAGQREPEYEQAVSYIDLEGGLPGLEGSLAWLECEIVEDYPGGDHSIFLMRVDNAAVNHETGDDPGAPLLYFGSGYRRFGSS